MLNGRRSQGIDTGTYYNIDIILYRYLVPVTLGVPHFINLQ